VQSEDDCGPEVIVLDGGGVCGRRVHLKRGCRRAIGPAEAVEDGCGRSEPSPRRVVIPRKWQTSFIARMGSAFWER